MKLVYLGNALHIKQKDVKSIQAALIALGHKVSQRKIRNSVCLVNLYESLGLSYSERAKVFSSFARNRAENAIREEVRRYWMDLHEKSENHCQ